MSLKELNDQYGSLPRDTFVETIVEKLSPDDLCNIRRSIYDLALETIPDITCGNLIVRKDTQGHGGLPASDKLADDIFNLVQYHGGDSNVDIVKIISEKSKCEYHKHRRQIPASNVTVSDQAVTLDIPIRQFCTELLTEMRKDRDLMSQEIKEMKSDIISTEAIQLEVRGHRTDFNGLLERVMKLESQQSRSPKLSHDIDEKLYQLTTSNTKMSDENLNVRNMFVASTARLNNLELAIRHRPPYVPFCTPTTSPQPALQSTSAIPVRIASDVRTPDLRDNVESAPNKVVTPDKASHTITHAEIVRRPSAPSDRVPSTIAEISHHQLNHRQPIDMDNFVIDTTGNRNASRTVSVTGSHGPQMTVIAKTNQTDNGQSSSVPKKPQDKRLRGFIHSAKDIFKVFFVSGILRNNNDIEDMVINVREHLEYNGCKVKTLKCVKQSKRTMSLKIVMYEEASSLVINEDFWPEGIMCRAWVDY